MPDAQNLRDRISKAAPSTVQAVAAIVEPWTRRIKDNLSRCTSNQTFPKRINDPVWGVIELYPWEVCLLDSPLLQRLRGIKQLGLAHTVYPGACHTRLEHVLGVLEASERMLRALERNAAHHRSFGADSDPNVPQVDDFDRCSIRTAALLHDVGHGSMSHVSERMIEDLLDEREAIRNVLRELDGVAKIAAAELMSVLIVLSEPMRGVFEHANFSNAKDRSDLPSAIAARIIGARNHLRAGYLSGIISGPVDADKIDYMARDSHHAGLPVGLDINRLINTLEVVVVTSQNAPKDLLQRASNEPNGRFYEMGISLAGVGAYEQFVIGRVILYDRVYHHHKIRSAEAMAIELIRVAQAKQAKPALNALYEAVSDESFISMIDTQSTDLANSILERNLYYRAFAFASRFIPLKGLAEDEQKQARALLWNPVLGDVTDPDRNLELRRLILETALRIAAVVEDLRPTIALKLEQIIIDLPTNKAVVRGNDILTRTENGDIAVPNLFFDPERWSQAYEHQKQVGYVFAPREYRALISLASRIVFYDRYRLATTLEGDKVSKTIGLIKDEWVKCVADHGICSSECFEALSKPKLVLIRMPADKITFPTDWTRDNPTLNREVSDGLNQVFPEGLVPSTIEAVALGVEQLANFCDMAERGGIFAGAKISEKDLQSRLRDHLRSAKVEVIEGSELAAGETDLVLRAGPMLIENKLAGKTAEPFDAKMGAAWQARRYNIAMVKRISLILIGFEPPTELDLPSLTRRVRVREIGPKDDLHAAIVFVVPYGYSSPSKAIIPPSA